jgi:hypothetical protein
MRKSHALALVIVGNTILVALMYAAKFSVAWILLVALIPNSIYSIYFGLKYYNSFFLEKIREKQAAGQYVDQATDAQINLNKDFTRIFAPAIAEMVSQKISLTIIEGEVVTIIVDPRRDFVIKPEWFNVIRNAVDNSATPKEIEENSSDSKNKFIEHPLATATA